jgi:hypothetical protein
MADRPGRRAQRYVELAAHHARTADRLQQTADVFGRIARRVQGLGERDEARHWRPAPRRRGRAPAETVLSRSGRSELDRGLIADASARTIRIRIRLHDRPALRLVKPAPDHHGGHGDEAVWF